MCSKDRLAVKGIKIFFLFNKVIFDTFFSTCYENIVYLALLVNDISKQNTHISYLLLRQTIEQVGLLQLERQLCLDTFWFMVGNRAELTK